MDEFKDILEEKNFNFYLKKYKKQILIGLTIFLLIITIIFMIFKMNKQEVNNTNINLAKTEEVKKEKKETKIKKYKVEIKGAVLNPSVYELEENSRIIDVINIAGGLNDEADTSYINLSKKITDEMVIIIYTKEEIEEYLKDQKESKYVYIEKECECPDEMNEACIQEKKQSKTSSKDDEVETENKLISINTATVDELQTLTGIGKSKAENIIKYRKENGKFETIEDLKNVTGIGDSIYEKIKDQITI